MSLGSSTRTRDACACIPAYGGYAKVPEGISEGAHIGMPVLHIN